jgi:hypothetical protein
VVRDTGKGDTQEVRLDHSDPSAKDPTKLLCLVVVDLDGGHGPAESDEVPSYRAIARAELDDRQRWRVAEDLRHLGCAAPVDEEVLTELVWSRVTRGSLMIVVLSRHCLSCGSKECRTTEKRAPRTGRGGPAYADPPARPEGCSG